MRWLAAACWLVCVGCASFAAREDYADYRAVRLAEGDEARLLAMQHYAASHPDGRWSDEIDRERRARDPEVFEHGKDTRRGIELYLKAFPDGTFATQATARLEAIALIEQRAREDAQRAAQREREQRAREEDLRRTWVSRFVGHWIKTLLAVQGWGDNIEMVARSNPEFSHAFAQTPRPRCTRDECVKYYMSRFGVRVPGGTRLEREVRIVLRLALREGTLLHADLLMPSWGYSRWRELEQGELVVDANPDERAAAIAYARSRIEPLLASLPGTWVPEEGVSLEPVAAPAIGPSGELTDTTAETPASPSNRIQGTEEPDASEVFAAEGPEAEPDMVVAPLRVRRDGVHVKQQSEPAPEAAPAAPDDGETMIIGNAAQFEQTGSPRQTIAFRNGQMRLVFFAAATTEGEPAFDGVRIEEVPAPTPPKKKTKRAAKP